MGGHTSRSPRSDTGPGSLQHSPNRRIYEASRKQQNATSGWHTAVDAHRSSAATQIDRTADFFFVGDVGSTCFRPSAFVRSSYRQSGPTTALHNIIEIFFANIHQSNVSGRDPSLWNVGTDIPTVRESLVSPFVQSHLPIVGKHSASHSTEFL
jgi:hypothetical protein